MKRGDDSLSPRLGRGNTVRHPQNNMDHIKISSPIELLSTTNVHALTAPDIRKVSADASSSSSSTHSTNDSEFSTIDRSFLFGNNDSNSTLATPLTPPMGSEKGFFEDITTSTMPEAPQLPKRCPSHSKKAHVELSRKRSIQRMSPPPTSLNRAASVRDTTAMFSANVQEAVVADSHPFGAELAKVNEVAEEFGATMTSAPIDEEEQEMLNKGLCKFGVEDYINEIVGLYGGVFEDRLGMAANPWF